jgi:hypothetical protein
MYILPESNTKTYEEIHISDEFTNTLQGNKIWGHQALSILANDFTLNSLICESIPTSELDNQIINLSSSCILSSNISIDDWSLAYPQENDEVVLDRYLNQKYLTMECVSDLTEKSEEDFEILLVAEFRTIPEVKAIYVDEYLDEKQIKVLLSMKQYDDMLMEVLINKEFIISGYFPDIIATFDYTPDLIDDRHSIISENTKLIYEK